MSDDRLDITMERASGRFHQIAECEAQLQTLQRRISDKKTEIKTLREQYDGVLSTLRAAARDEGELPLFPFGFPAS